MYMLCPVWHLEPRKVVPRITREIIQEWYPQLSEYDLVHIVA